jgi:hypothetical protein
MLGALLMAVAGLAQADTLTGVLPTTPGGTNYQAYYDATTNLTWLANANMNGLMDWSAANSWAAGLDINGVTGWTLPTTADTSCIGINCTGSEMGYLFYDVLGGTAGHFLSNTGPFSNVQSDGYWSATGDAPSTNYLAWEFDFYYGAQYIVNPSYGLFAWAVHAGDVGAPTSAPEPGALALMLVGLGLVGFAARRRLALR